MSKKRYISEDPCIVCGRAPSDRHHILSRGAYIHLKDKEWNMINLCREHHRCVHDRGLAYLAQKNKPVRNWLKTNGFHFDFFTEKWVRRNPQNRDD